MSIPEKRYIHFIFLISLCLLLTGCGHVKSAKKLVKAARLYHGACELVSKEESEDSTVVVLRDKLQGFEYKMTSAMYGLHIDGSSFGSLPYTNDTFDQSLHSFALDNTRDTLDQIGLKYGAVYEPGGGDVIVIYTLSSGAPDEAAARIVEEASRALQEYNVKNRMDGVMVNVEHDDEWLKKILDKKETVYGLEYEYMLSGSGSAVAKHIGSARLPECRFRDRAAEQQDYYTDIALTKTDKARFLRKENKTFADTGLSPYRVVSQFDKTYPQESTDPVTFYYFTDGNREFFICDFLDSETETWYTDF